MLDVEMVVGKPRQEMRVGPYRGHEEILASEVLEVVKICNLN